MTGPSETLPALESRLAEHLAAWLEEWAEQHDARAKLARDAAGRLRDVSGRLLLTVELAPASRWGLSFVGRVPNRLSPDQHRDVGRLAPPCGISAGLVDLS